jgi:hypothetical protein
VFRVAYIPRRCCHLLPYGTVNKLCYCPFQKHSAAFTSVLQVIVYEGAILRANEIALDVVITYTEFINPLERNDYHMHHLL